MHLFRTKNESNYCAQSASHNVEFENDCGSSSRILLPFEKVPEEIYINTSTLKTLQVYEESCCSKSLKSTNCNGVKNEYAKICNADYQTLANSYSKNDCKENIIMYPNQCAQNDHDHSKLSFCVMDNNTANNQQNELSSADIKNSQETGSKLVNAVFSDEVYSSPTNAEELSDGCKSRWAVLINSPKNDVNFPPESDISAKLQGGGESVMICPNIEDNSNSFGNLSLYQVPETTALAESIAIECCCVNPPMSFNDSMPAISVTFNCKYADSAALQSSLQTLPTFSHNAAILLSQPVFTDTLQNIPEFSDELNDMSVLSKALLNTCTLSGELQTGSFLPDALECCDTSQCVPAHFDALLNSPALLNAVQNVPLHSNTSDNVSVPSNDGTNAILCKIVKLYLPSLTSFEANDLKFNDMDVASFFLQMFLCSNKPLKNLSLSWDGINDDILTCMSKNLIYLKSLQLVSRNIIMTFISNTLTMLCILLSVLLYCICIYTYI